MHFITNIVFVVGKAVFPGGLKSVNDGATFAGVATMEMMLWALETRAATQVLVVKGPLPGPGLVGV